MLEELRGYPLLTGYRGAPPCDVPALVQAIVKVSRLAWAARGQVAEIDINPVLVGPAGQGLWVADALIVMGAAPQEALAAKPQPHAVQALGD